MSPGGGKHIVGDKCLHPLGRSFAQAGAAGRRQSDLVLWVPQKFSPGPLRRLFAQGHAVAVEAKWAVLGSWIPGSKGGGWEGRRAGRGNCLPEPEPKAGAGGAAEAQEPETTCPLLGVVFQCSQQSGAHPCNCCCGPLQVMRNRLPWMPQRERVQNPAAELRGG